VDDHPSETWQEVGKQNVEQQGVDVGVQVTLSL
jgi:hypothetical protein